jgi:hypothetical protein
MTNPDCTGNYYGEFCDTDLNLCGECLADGDVCTETGTYCAAEPLILEVTSVPPSGSEVISGETVTFILDTSDKDCYLPEGERSILVDDPAVVPSGASGGGWPAGDWVRTESGFEWVVPPVCGDTPVDFPMMALNDMMTDMYFESAGQNIQFTIKYELNSENQWRIFTDLPPYLPDACYGNLPCDGPDGEWRHDACGNTLDLMCATETLCGGFGCAWRYVFNDMLISSCIWPYGVNMWYYERSYIGETDRYIFSKVKHASQDDSCGDGCTDRSCALITTYDCIAGGGARQRTWRSAACRESSEYDTGLQADTYIENVTDGEPCPGHPDRL